MPFHVVNRSWYREAVLRKRDAGWSGVYISSGGDLSISISTKVFDSTGSAVGVAAADMRLFQIEDGLRAATRPTDAVTYIFEYRFSDRAGANLLIAASVVGAATGVDASGRAVQFSLANCTSDIIR